VVLKVSDGIGAGILLDGSLRVGDKNNAGEIGHTVVESKGVLCPCGHYGCLETVATTRVFLEKGREIYRSCQDSIAQHFCYEKN